MKSVIAPCASARALVAPAGSSRPSIRSSRFKPSRSIVIWHGIRWTPISLAASISSWGLATWCSLARWFIIAGPAPAKFILDSFRCWSPPRFIVDSIFCIQFSPVMRTWFLTSGKRPQNVKKTVVSLPIAAPVVARIRVGQILSSSPLEAKITSFSVCSAFFSASCSANCASGGFSIVLTLMSDLLLLEDEMEDGALLRGLHQRVAGRLCPRFEIGDRTGVGGERLEQLARSQRLHRLRRLDDRHRAREAFQVEGGRDRDAHVSPPWLRQASLRDGVPVRLVEQRLRPMPPPCRRRRDGRVVVVEANGRGLSLSGLQEAHDLAVVDVCRRSLALYLGGDLGRGDGGLVVRNRAALGDRDARGFADRPDVRELRVLQRVLVHRHPTSLIPEARLLDHLLAAMWRDQDEEVVAHGLALERGDRPGDGSTDSTLKKPVSSIPRSARIGWTSFEVASIVKARLSGDRSLTSVLSRMPRALR